MVLVGFSETGIALECEGPSTSEHSVAEYLGYQDHEEHAQYNVPSHLDGLRTLFYFIYFGFHVHVLIY